MTDGTTWVQQPRFGPDGRLYWIEEAGEWASLVRDGAGDAAERQVFGADGLEFGLPGWFLGGRVFDFLPDGRVVTTAVDAGLCRFVVVDPAAGSVKVLDSDAVALDGLTVAADGRVLCRLSSRVRTRGAGSARPSLAQRATRHTSAPRSS